MPQFPLNARVRSKAEDTPPSDELEVGIFDDKGFWASFGSPAPSISLPADLFELGTRIAAFANQAYEQGRRDQAQRIRNKQEELEWELNYGSD